MPAGQLVQGIACLCLELEKLKQVGNEPGTLYDFAVLDALWSGIVRSSTAMHSFLLADGLGSLLDVLDCGAAALKPLLLTIAAGNAVTAPLFCHAAAVLQSLLWYVQS